MPQQQQHNMQASAIDINRLSLVIKQSLFKFSINKCANCVNIHEKYVIKMLLRKRKTRQSKKEEHVIYVRRKTKIYLHAVNGCSVLEKLNISDKWKL